MGESLEWARKSKGDAKLREEYSEAATIVLELVAHEAKRGAPTVVRPEECEATLSQFQNMVQFVDLDDAASMASLKALARQSLEAFGVPLFD